MPDQVLPAAPPGPQTLLETHARAFAGLTAAVPGLAHDFIESAEGNWLYHHGADGKESVPVGAEDREAAFLPQRHGNWCWVVFFFVLLDENKRNGEEAKTNYRAELYVD